MDHHDSEVKFTCNWEDGCSDPNGVCQDCWRRIDAMYALLVELCKQPYLDRYADRFKEVLQ